MSASRALCAKLLGLQKGFLYRRSQNASVDGSEVMAKIMAARKYISNAKIGWKLKLRLKSL